MILRRVIENLRQQQWTAVFIELAIVVLGVFMGLQVDTWNRARVQAAEEHVIRMRLHEEFKALEPILSAAASQLAETSRSTGLVIDILRAGERPADPVAFKVLLRRANFVWDAPTLSATYIELISTGGLANISDADLRAALIRYSDFSKKYERALPTASAIVLEPHSNYLRAVEWNTNPDKWDGPDAVVSYDWDALLASKAEMQAWQAHQRDLASYTQGELTELRAAIRILEEDEK